MAKISRTIRADEVKENDFVASLGMVENVIPCRTEPNCVHILGDKNWCIARGQLVEIAPR